MTGPLFKVGALCVTLAAATAAATFYVVTHIAAGERGKDPRLGDRAGRFGW